MRNKNIPALSGYPEYTEGVSVSIGDIVSFGGSKFLWKVLDKTNDGIKFVICDRKGRVADETVFTSFTLRLNKNA